MSFQDYAMYAEEFFGSSTAGEGTKYILEDRCSLEKKFSEDHPYDTDAFGVLICKEWARITHEGKTPKDFAEIAPDYKPPVRIENGVMIIPRFLSHRELQDVARSFAHAYSKSHL